MLRRSLYASDLDNIPGASAVLEDYKDYTDPEYVGPGTWNTLHRLAFLARTREQQLIYINFLKQVCEGFPCLKCREHCKKYLLNHPPEKYLEVSIIIDGEKLELGMFVYSWKFHNSVNARLKKPIMSWTTAYNMYSDKGSQLCSKKCMSTEINHTKDSNANKHDYEEEEIQAPFKIINVKRRDNTHRR